MIVDVPAEIGAGYLQSASQASPPWASLLGHRKFGCNSCMITLASDRCFELAGRPAIDGASHHDFSRHTSKSYSISIISPPRAVDSNLLLQKGHLKISKPCACGEQTFNSKSLVCSGKIYYRLNINKTKIIVN
jgi:hypothetical protein